jgi:hypothetical protein
VSRKIWQPWRKEEKKNVVNKIEKIGADLGHRPFITGHGSSGAKRSFAAESTVNLIHLKNVTSQKLFLQPIGPSRG